MLISIHSFHHCAVRPILHFRTNISMTFLSIFWGLEIFKLDPRTPWSRATCHNASRPWDLDFYGQLASKARLLSALVCALLAVPVGRLYDRVFHKLPIKQTQHCHHSPLFSLFIVSTVRLWSSVFPTRSLAGVAIFWARGKNKKAT